MRLAIVGSSHVSAFRNAWSEFPGRWPGVEAEFFAMPYDVFQRMVVTEDLRLVRGPGRAWLRQEELTLARRINGREEAALAGADLVLAVGIPYLYDEPLLALLDGSDIDGLRSVGAPRQMSAAAFEAMLGVLVGKSRPPASWNRPGLRGRLVMMQRPLPSETAIPSARAKFAMRRRIARRPEGVVEALGRYVRGVREALAAHGVRLFPQPAETITREGLTLERFTRGFRRIHDDTVNERDHIHANAAFGALCLDRILAEALSGRQRGKMATIQEGA